MIGCLRVKSDWAGLLVRCLGERRRCLHLVVRLGRKPPAGRPRGHRNPGPQSPSRRAGQLFGRRTCVRNRSRQHGGFGSQFSRRRSAGLEPRQEHSLQPSSSARARTAVSHLQRLFWPRVLHWQRRVFPMCVPLVLGGEGLQQARLRTRLFGQWKVHRSKHLSMRKGIGRVPRAAPSKSQN